MLRRQSTFVLSMWRAWPLLKVSDGFPWSKGSTRLTLWCGGGYMLGGGRWGEWMLTGGFREGKHLAQRPCSRRGHGLFQEQTEGQLLCKKGRAVRNADPKQLPRMSSYLSTIGIYSLLDLMCIFTIFVEFWLELKFLYTWSMFNTSSDPHGERFS